MNRSTKPATRILLSAMLALIPAGLMLLVLHSMLQPGSAPEAVPAIEATLLRTKPPPTAAAHNASPQEVVAPRDEARPAPSASAETNPQAPVASLSIESVPESAPESAPESHPGNNPATPPTTDWDQAIDRFMKYRRSLDEPGYADLPPSYLPPAMPVEPDVDPKLGWYNGAGELVRDISKHCRAEQRDAIRNDNFVPPPVIFCKRPPGLILPLRTPPYLRKKDGDDYRGPNP